MTSAKTLDSYQVAAIRTLQEFREGKAKPLALGFIGEIGGFLSVAKKRQRDAKAFLEYEKQAYEECGDALWYLAAISHSVGLPLSQLAKSNAFDDLQADGVRGSNEAEDDGLNKQLVQASVAAARFADTIVHDRRRNAEKDGREALQALASAASYGGVSLPRAAELNLLKISERWPAEEECRYPPLFDEGLERHEQIPRTLTVEFRDIRDKKGSIRCYPLRGGLPMGDPLTDNADAKDGYRFHDVFHLSYAAKLGWSPVLRALMRLKRKSQPEKDENEDGARAAIAEEAVANWLFSNAETHNFFKDPRSLDFETLKIVREMTKKYEVRDIPFWVWEEAIREGFAVFCQLRDNGGGIVTIDLNARTIEYRPREA